MMNQGVFGWDRYDEVPEMQENYQIFVRQQHEEKRLALAAERQRKASRTSTQRLGEGFRNLFRPPQEVLPTYGPDYQLYGRPAYGYHVDTRGQMSERHGPVDWDQYFTQWDTIGQDYEKPLLNEEQKKFMEKKGIEFTRMLGKGGFGQVWEVKMKVKGKIFKKHMACKVMNIKMFEQYYAVRDAVPKLLNDSEVMKNLEHRNIAKQTDVILLSDEITGFPYCFIFQFMELCDGSLYNMHMNLPGFKMTVKDAKNWFRDVANGLKYLHDNHISHMDIKPQNILYKNESKSQQMPAFVYKLTDFGLSVKFDALAPNIVTKPLGTPVYMAPEVMQSHQYETKPADIYSLGLTLVASVCQMNTQPKPHLNRILQRVPNQYGIDQDCLNLIECMCRSSPSDRWTIDRVLASNWLRS